MRKRKVTRAPSMASVTLIPGDCLEIMRNSTPESVDSIITDPPYGLEFMGKEWDRGSPGVEFWKAALRVAKPGCILLCFGGTRTYHRLACAIEDAGWEIRDCIMWLYGSGFPKSLDVSKAIDKEAGAEREKIRVSSDKVRNPKSIDSGHGIDGGDRPWMQKALEIGYHEKDDNTAVTEDAKRWQGWGTALKPSYEPVLVAMKPLDGTYAHNALTHGVAGLNIDGARIAGTVDLKPYTRTKEQRISQAANHKNVTYVNHPSGRWPANVIHDGSDEVVSLFPDSKSGSRLKHHKLTGGTPPIGTFSIRDRTGEKEFLGDSGSAARFFYCAKASKAERGEGNAHPTVKPLALMEYLCKLTATPTGGVVLDPFMGSGTTGVACGNLGRPFIGIELDPIYFGLAERRIGCPVQP